MMYGRGYFLDGGCFGLFGSWWNIIILVGVLFVIASVIYFARSNSKKLVSNEDALETLKLKFVHGEITEDEYLKRKSVLDRK